MDSTYTRPVLLIAAAAIVGWMAYETLFQGFHLSVRLMMWLVGVVTLGWLAYEHFYGEDYRPRTLIALSVVLAGVGFLEYRAQSAELKLSHAASVVAKRPVSVRCQGLLGHMVDIGQELGTVQFTAEGDPADVTHIKREACGWAMDYARGNRRVTEQHAIAVEVISHESIHLRGWPNEAITECYGMQNMTDVAKALGATNMQAQQLAEHYFDTVYPRMPDEYRNETDCRDEGKWDIHKGDPAWP